MSNRLSLEQSPYLLQHKDNPVDWWPWGEQAIEAAHASDRPIFLSIGYATCHWCHVMERESFEDSEVARLLNKTFINIKVDREERPDIDAIYMDACQIATGRGGWPLTVMMTPEMQPFFIATYLPKTQRYGQEGLLEIIPKINQIWEQQRELVYESAGEFTNALIKSSNLDLSGQDLTEEALHRAFRRCEQEFDFDHGGFGTEPKFPTPEKLRFLLRYWYRTAEPKALEMVEVTLQQIRRGGIYDQIGGGFHRYSTDRIWRVPHFEKMLYDQALLLLTYLEAYQVTRKQEYLQTVRHTIAYLQRELRNSEGAYYTGEDADSEGIEGKYYVWDINEIRRILTPEQAKEVEYIFNLGRKGNYLDEATRKLIGQNILYRAVDDTLTDSEHLSQASDRLLQSRSQRIRPLLDDKILTDWNGLMIMVLAKCGMVLGDLSLIRDAEKCLQFIETYLISTSGQLLHRWREEVAGIPGLLDDYAFLIGGLIALYEATGNERHCTLAKQFTETVLSDFVSNNGDFFMVAEQNDDLLLRPKQLFDTVIPSGNSMMMMNLFRLSKLTGDPELEANGHQAMKAFSSGIWNQPTSFCGALSALDYALGPSYEIIVSGPRDAHETDSALSALRSRYFPNAVIASRREFANTNEFAIHLCYGNTCELPTKNLEEVLSRISKSSAMHHNLDE
ncbi:MAG: thioredoxin domain-containing protein [Bacteroidetes bacterium]|nr:thioredoxin domain-containing protein [Bacteroidota bacterium]